MADDGPADVTPPDLNLPTTTGPSVDGRPQTGDGQDLGGRRGKGVPAPAASPPSHAKYAVSPGSVSDAGNEILSRSQQSVNTYDDLKSTVQAVSGWVFWEQAPGTQVMDISGQSKYMTDPHPELTNQIAAAEHNLLLGIADSITLAGQFAGQLNNAAQFYAQADKASALPDTSFSMDAGTIGQAPNPGGTGTGVPVDSPKGGGTGEGASDEFHSPDYA